MDALRTHAASNRTTLFGRVTRADGFGVVENVDDDSGGGGDHHGGQIAHGLEGARTHEMLKSDDSSSSNVVGDSTKDSLSSGASSSSSSSSSSGDEVASLQVTGSTSSFLERMQRPKPRNSARYKSVNKIPGPLEIKLGVPRVALMFLTRGYGIDDGDGAMLRGHADMGAYLYIALSMRCNVLCTHTLYLYAHTLYLYAHTLYLYAHILSVHSHSLSITPPHPPPHVPPPTHPHTCAPHPPTQRTPHGKRMEGIP